MKRIRSAAHFLFILILLCALPVSAHASDSKTVVASNPGVAIFIDERLLRPVDADGAAVAPLIIDGTTYLPVRAVSEALGLRVEWDGEAGAVYLSNDHANERQFSMYNPPASSFTDNEISIFPGAVKVYYNSVPISADSFLYNGTTYLPLRAISETLGFDVEWHANAKSITISSEANRAFFATVNVPSLSSIVGCDPCYMESGSGYIVYMYDAGEFDGTDYINAYPSLLGVYGFFFDPASNLFVNSLFRLGVSINPKTLSDTFSVLEIVVTQL